MDKNKYCVSAITISPRTTLEGLLNLNKKQLQVFLKTNKSKISGNKLTLAQRAYDVIVIQRQGLGLDLVCFVHLIFYWKFLQCITLKCDLMSFY